MDSFVELENFCEVSIFAEKAFYPDDLHRISVSRVYFVRSRREGNDPQFGRFDAL